MIGRVKRKRGQDVLKEGSDRPKVEGGRQVEKTVGEGMENCAERDQKGNKAEEKEG